MKDNIFSKKLNKITKFEFDETVASVFDDMLNRSIPFYDEIHKIILDILEYTFHNNDTIYDLGCSTGTTLTLLHNFLKFKKNTSRFKLIGIDNSMPMIKKAKIKLQQNKITNTKLMCSDLEKIKLSTSGMIIMNYTLQFIPEKKRETLIKTIFDSLREGGIFIFSEKIISNNENINDLLTTLYYNFKKRNGYSEIEIAQKREALENVLIPLAPNSQIELLKNAGFKKVETIFRWYNFASFIGIK